MGRLDDAIASHREAVRLNDGFYESHAHLGDALQANGQLEEAITCYRESVRLLKLSGTVVHIKNTTFIQPNPVGVYIRFGNALRANGKIEEAATCYQEAIECYKQRSIPSQRFDADSYRQIAWLFGTCPDLRFRNADEALATAKKSQLLSPQDVQTWNTLGVCFLPLRELA